MPSRRVFKERILREARQQSVTSVVNLGPAISALPTSTTFTATDDIPLLRGGVAYKGAASALRTYVLGISGGTATIPENLNVQGNTTLGNATGDTITLTGRVASDIVPTTTDAYRLGLSTLGFQELWIQHNASRASGLNLVQTLAGQGSPRLFFNNTTDFPGAANAIFQIGSNQLGFTTGGTPGSSSGTTRWSYTTAGIYPASASSYELGNATFPWSRVVAARMTAPLFGTQTATDVVIDRNSVTQLTIGSLTATFAGALIVTGDLTQNSTQAIVAQSSTTARLAVGTGSGSSTTQLDIQSAAGQFAIQRWRSGSSARWQFTKDNDAEGGANAGSTFRGQAFDDAGTFIDNWLTVTRAAGSTIAFNSARPITGGTYNGQTISSAASFTGTLGVSGVTTLSNLSGVGSRMVVADASGVLSTAAIPTGDVVGPASATNNAVALFDLTTGKLLKNSVVLVNAGAVTGVTSLTTTDLIVNGLQTVNVASADTSALTFALSGGSSAVFGATSVNSFQTEITTASRGWTILVNTQEYRLWDNSFRVPVAATFVSSLTASGITSTGAVSLSPANLNVVLSPTGTGVVTINPATAGTLNNVVIGGSTPLAGTFTTLAGTTRVTSPRIGTTTATNVVFDRNGVTQLTLDSLAATFAGSLAITGAMTGVTTLNASGAVTASQFSASTGLYEHTLDDAVVIVRGQASNFFASELRLYGMSHATLANDIVLHNGTADVMNYDFSAARVTFGSTLEVRANIYGATLQYNVNGIKVVGEQGAAVTDPTGGTVQDSEARTAIIAIIDRLQAHGLIA